MRRTARNLGLTFAAIAALAVLAGLFRVPLAEAGIRWWLAREGIDRAAFSIAAFGADGVVIADIGAGTDDAIRIARIAVAWSPATLLRGRVDTVTVEGLAIRAIVADGTVQIPGVTLPAAGAPGGKPFALPLRRLDIADGHLELATPYGPLVVVATAHYGESADGVAGTVSVAAQGEPGRVRLTASVRGPDAGRLDGTIDMPEGAIDTPVVRADAFSGNGGFSIVDGRLVGASVSLQAPRLSLPTVPGGMTGRLDVAAGYADGKATLDLAFAEAEGGRGLAGSVRLADIAAGGDVLAADAVVEGTLQRFATGAIALQGLTAGLPLAIRRTGGSVEVTLTDAGRFSADRIAGDGMRSRAPVVVTLPKTGAPLATLTLGDDGMPVAVAHTLTAAIAPTGLVIGAGKAARTLDLAETRLTWTGRYDAPDGYTGRGTLANTGAQTDDPALALQRIEADVTVTDIAGNGRLRVDIGRLADKAVPERFTAVGVALNVTRTDGKARLVATLRDATQTIRATASGPWPLDGPRDEIFVDIPPLAFETGGKQPSTLSPLLAAFEVSRGRVFGNVRIRRDGGGYGATVDATLEDMAFAVAGADVAGLDASVHFDSLDPPATPAHQHLSIKRIDLVTPIEDVQVDYRVTSLDGAPVIDIASARADLLGGRVEVADSALALDGRMAALPLTVTRLDVARLLDLLGVEGLAGSGSLSGRVPLLLSPAKAAIRDGRLTADGPGVLKLNTRTAADFLASQGPSVDLAVRALEDFHYSELAIDITREPAGAAQLKLTMLGQNPAVLDGQPFRFNINLKSNVDELIAALLQGYRVATDRVGRTAGDAKSR